MTTMQGLTPTIIVTLPESVDLTQAEHVYPTIKQGGKVVRISNFVFTAQQVSIYLTQEDTLALSPGAAEVQVNWTYAGGQRGAIKPKGMTILSNHLTEVLP